MKRIVTTLAAITLAATLAGAASGQTFDNDLRGPNGIDRRQWRQSWRVHDGVRDRDLTRREARRLWAGQRRIHRIERHRWHDGRLSMRDRFRLHRSLDRQSRRIHRLRYNGRPL